MSGISRCGAMLAVSLLLSWPSSASAQGTFTGNVYIQNFDSMGTAGTTPPSGWFYFNIATGSNATWDNTTGINPAEVGGGTPSAGLVVAVDPAGNQNNGYNAATSANTADRAIASAPTGGSGNAIELALTNNTGVAQPSLRIGYDIRRFTVAGTENELPGYWLFYSLDNGATYTNVPEFNPVVSGAPPMVIVPNSQGVTTVPETPFTLSSPLPNGSTILLRWVDDNAVQSSPDQIVGLDNVRVVAPVPEPASILALCAVAFLAGRKAVRWRAGRGHGAAEQPV